MYTHNNLEEIFNKYLNELKQINEYIFNNPELGHQEFKASKIHCDFLEKNGFEVVRNYVNIPTAYRASFKNGNSNVKIAILAEYDALPGIGHGCGHNIFGVTSLATGILIKEMLKNIEGEVIIIGTPAEETDGAKVEMVKLGVFDDIDIAMASHPMGEAHFKSGKSQAMEALRFIFRGKTAHAAASPHEGINALDGVINLFNTINALRQQTLDSARIHGIVSNGGKAANIIPDYASADFYVRAETLEYLKELVGKVKKCAEGSAIATGTTLEIINYETSFANLVTNQTLSDIYVKNLEIQGIKDIREPEPSGSTDMGDVSHCCPTIHPYFPLSTKTLTAHSVEFAQATLENEAYIGMKQSAIAMALTALDIFSNSQLLEKIKMEFNNK